MMDKPGSRELFGEHTNSPEYMKPQIPSLIDDMRLPENEHANISARAAIDAIDKFGWEPGEFGTSREELERIAKQP